jgi:hypothetical protein
MKFACVICFMLFGCNRIYEKVRFKYDCPENQLKCVHIMMAVQCECLDGGK